MIEYSLAQWKIYTHPKRPIIFLLNNKKYKLKEIKCFKLTIRYNEAARKKSIGSQASINEYSN